MEIESVKYKNSKYSYIIKRANNHHLLVLKTGFIDIGIQSPEDASNPYDVDKLWERQIKGLPTPSVEGDYFYIYNTNDTLIDLFEKPWVDSNVFNDLHPALVTLCKYLSNDADTVLVNKYVSRISIINRIISKYKGKTPVEHKSVFEVLEKLEFLNSIKNGKRLEQFDIKKSGLSKQVPYPNNFTYPYGTGFDSIIF